MYYKFVLMILLAVIPGVYLYYFPVYCGRQKVRTFILGSLSLISIFVLTQIITYKYNIHYMVAVITFSYAIYYAGKGWGLFIAAVLILYDYLQFSSPQQFLQYVTYITIITFVFILSHTRFHMLDGTRKILFMLSNLCTSSVLLILFSLHISEEPFIFLRSSNEAFETLVKCFVFIVIVFLSYSGILKQEQAQHYRKKYETIKESHDELRTWVQVIQYAPFAVLNINRDEQIIYANQQAYQNYDRLSEIDVQSTRRQQLSHVLSDASYPVVSRLIQQVFETSIPIHTTVQNEDQELMYSAIPIYSIDKDGLHAVGLFVQDVTELQELRRELDRMDRLSLVGEMAASITHEIRNPMAVVRGYVQLLQERSHVAQREYFSIIIEELDRTNQIISDFLTLAQNKREQKFSNSLNDVINELVPLLQADANLRGQMLVVELSDQLPPYQINESEIKQLLLNISRNGMEAMQQDGVLTIKTMFVNRQIILSIADTGLGIPDELKQKIFEPFYSSKRMGTGLGLPLCANIVHRHNGKISVLNNSQQGTIFQIHFPLEEQLLSS